MPKIEYKTIRMSPERLALVEKAIEFITFFRSQGYSLTLRQLYTDSSHKTRSRHPGPILKPAAPTTSGPTRSSVTSSAMPAWAA